MLAKKRSLIILGVTLGVMVLLAALISALVVSQIDVDQLSLAHASFLSSTGQENAALAELDHITEDNPRNFDALYRKGEILYSLDRNTEGLRVFQKATKLRPRHTMSWIYLSYFLLEAKRYDETVRAANKAIALGPPHPYAWNNRGVGLEWTGRTNEALKSFDRAIELDAQYFHALNNKASLLYRIDRANESLAPFDQAIKSEPNNYEGWYGRGLAFIDLQRYDAAVSDLKRASMLYPRYPEVWDRLGLAYGAENRPGEAKAAFRNGLNNVPGDPDLLTHQMLLASGESRHKAAQFMQAELDYLKGERLVALGRQKQAIVMFNKTISVLPGNAGAVRGKAECQLKLGLLEEALDTYNALIRTNARDTNALWAKANLLKRLGRNDEAQAVRDLIVQMETELRSRDIGSANRTSGRTQGQSVSRELAFAEAEQQVDAFLAVPQGQSPSADFEGGLGAKYGTNSKEAFRQLLIAKALSQANEPVYVVEAIDKALEYDSKYVAAWLFKAQALAMSGRLDGALAAAEQAIQVTPDAPAGWEMKSQILGSLGRTDEAVKAADEAGRRGSQNAKQLKADILKRAK